MKGKKQRLDMLLVDRSLFASREQAQRAIMAGEVRVGEQVAGKPSQMVVQEDVVTIRRAPQYVGRGGVKLAGALDHFRIDVNGAIALDVGASTGGFTDCLLQRGAAKVYAIDVGHGQLAWKIRQDPRVIVREKLNARFLSRADIVEAVGVCVIDVSFISLTLVLPNAFELLTPDGVILALIKPQFELQPEDVGRGGIVVDAALHEKAQAKVRDLIQKSGHEVVGTAPSVITGTEGNQEFFICAHKRSV
jgi:23S rRNA (cytidine1920-2'-O)/16S rRNA (cytidine1409-2'-O)-methyltransferase